eukprot:Clim_evm7s235 gene=Clim_evmTU7s235
MYSPRTNRSPLGGQSPGMTLRDRTNEFFSISRNIKDRKGVMQSHSSAGKPIHQKSEFARAAQTIGKSIQECYMKLEKLTMLAKKKNLFEDNNMEIQDLTYIIKQDINALNQQIGQLQSHIRNRAATMGSSNQKHTENVVIQLQTRLAKMSNDFKDVLEVRTKSLQEQKDRRSQFSADTRDAPMESSLLMQEHARQQSQNAYNPYGDQYGGPDGGTGSQGHVGIDMGGSMAQGQQYMQQGGNQEYLQSRHEAVNQIESTITELGTVFQQLARMVQEQGEQIMRIDANVQDAEMNIEGAHNELLKYFTSISNNRMLFLKVFGVLLFFFIFFVVFVA